MNERNIPDCMREQYEQSNEEGRVKLEILARQYEEERAIFLQSTFVAKQQFQRDWNRLTGQRKELTVTEALRPIDSRYQAMAQEVVTAQDKEQEISAEQQPERPQLKQVKPESDRQPLLSRKEQFLQSLDNVRRGRPVYQRKETGEGGEEIESRQNLQPHLKGGNEQQVPVVRPHR